jgi:hypothetical protein
MMDVWGELALRRGGLPGGNGEAANREQVAVTSVTCWSFESSRRRASAFASTRTGGNARHPRDHGGCAGRTPPCNMPSRSRPGSPAAALLSTRSGLRSVETVNVGQWLMARMFRRLGLVP